MILRFWTLFFLLPIACVLIPLAIGLHTPTGTFRPEAAAAWKLAHGSAGSVPTIVSFDSRHLRFEVTDYG